jgi:hypothetical protein
LAIACACAHAIEAEPTWPGPQRDSLRDASREFSGVSVDSLQSCAKRIEAQPVCVATRADAAGKLGQSLLYHFRRDGSKIRVGYFAYWTTERPWGQNLMTYTVVPALLTDAFYSHFLFVMPGAQRVLYGPGDVEGALVVFEEQSDGKLRVIGGSAESEDHDAVELGIEDLVDERGRIFLASDVWSHQLGAGAKRAQATRGDFVTTCFQGRELSPLTEALARDFRLGTLGEPRRARIAWQLAPRG